MATEKFRVDGLSDLLKDLEDRDPLKGVAILRKGARKAMEPVKRDMKAGAHRREGDLQESIDMQARVGSRSDRNRVLTIRVGPLKKKAAGKDGKQLSRTNAKAGAQEYGTSAHGQQADPFIRPALEKNKHSVLQDLKVHVKHFLEKGKKK